MTDAADADRRALDVEAAQLAKERDAVETSPAQPDDEHRIDADAMDGEALDAPAEPHRKHDHPGRMTHG